jgi:hypothetical protein
MRTLPDPYALAILLADAVLMLLLYERLLAALRGTVACVRSNYSAHEMLGNNYLCSSVAVMAVMIIPFFTMSLVVSGVSHVGFMWTLVALVGLLLFRKLVYGTMGWLTSRQSAFHSLEILSYAFAVGMMVASVPAYLVGWLAPSAPDWLCWGWMGLMSVGVAVLYVWRASSIILQTGFSYLYWVLYLCALEFLPICVVVNILINGN